MNHPATERVTRLRRLLENSQCDALVVSHGPNVYYLTGFHGSAGVAVAGRNATTLFVDARYAVQAAKQARGCKVVVARDSLLDAVSAHLRRGRRTRIGFEAHRLTVAQAALLKRLTGRKAGHSWVATEGMVEGLRSVKAPSEITAIRAAGKLGCRVFGEILPLIRVGVRESEIAAEIEHRLRQRGAEGASFESIVAAGARSALPHARPTTRRLRRNELVVLDMGAILGHYCSDLTRTVYLGRAPGRLLEWHRAVREAHEAAVAALQPGTTGGQVDEAARQVLRKYGLERLFIHSTGHGLGLEVHEEPRLARGSKAVLEAGNVVTIEPGVYLEGSGGIRIEDDYLVTPRGAERLTQTCKEVFEL